MKLKLFLVPSLVAAGLLPQQAAAIPTEDAKPADTGKTSLFQAFKLQHLYTLAAHRSHSSHASHSSHRSSSGGSVYRAPVYTAPTPTYTPAPVYTPPASDSTSPASILPTSPDAALKILPGNSDKFL